MVKWRRTPAIFAGLAGSAAWSVPVIAQAAPADEALVTMSDLLASPVAYFFVGLATGAVVTGVSVGAAGHHARKKLERQLEEARAQSRRLQEEGLVIRVSSPGVVLDFIPGDTSAIRGPHRKPSDGGLEALATPSYTSYHDAPVNRGGSEDGTSRLAGASAASPSGPSREVAEPEAAPVLRSHASEHVTPLDEMASFTAPLHVRERLNSTLPGFGDAADGAQPATPAAEQPLPQTVVPVSPGESVPAGTGQSEVTAPPPEPPAQKAPREGSASAPRPEGSSKVTAQGASPSRSGVAPVTPAQGAKARRFRNPEENYELIAEEYVKKLKAAERQSHKARGVHATLSERLRGNVMEGLPVIERADGSTNDIGTSWWTKEVGSTHSFAPLDPSTTANLPPVTEAPDPMSTSALRRAELIRAERNAQAAGFSGSLGLQTAGAQPEQATPPLDDTPHGAGAEDDTARLSQTQRAAAIADRLSSVDMSLYPEERTAAAESEDDMFEQALRAMDEQDTAATVTTSAESANNRVPLTGDLRTGAVVTSESLAQARQEREVEEHVDSLVRDEFERNRARHNQRTAHSILTVFEGTGDLSDVRRGQHFAQPKQPDDGRGEEQA